MIAPLAHATPAPWALNLQHPSYGTDETYRLAAEWLCGCTSVADWGGGTGYFGRFLAPSVRYVVVDGTPQTPGCVCADLSSYREPSDGILLRHVLDQAEDWLAVLNNAVASFQRRMVVVTFTPMAEVTSIVKRKSGWPVRHFNPDDLIAVMRPHVVVQEWCKTSHPEMIYYLERAA